MSADKPHIVIAGGGMVGLSLALLLDKQLAADVRITLVEGIALPDAGTAPSDYHPSFDARSTALSYSTAKIYRELGVWSSLESGLGPIQRIHVSRQGRFGSSLLEASEQAWEALGWVVENPCLGRTLLAALRDRPRLELRCPERVSAARPRGDRVEVSLGAATIAADLLVIADGAESSLREKLGFFTRRKSYAQRAVIANVEFEQDHRGCAYERFTATGPLALLPLPALSDAPNRMALVWSLPPKDALELESAGDEHFKAALLDTFGYRLGRIRRVGGRHGYPLSLTESVEQARRGFVVLGNAAHALHPVAGQGFNLALRDALCLTRCVSEALQNDLSPGAPEAMDRYALMRSRDQAQIIAASDLLPDLFMSTDPILSLGRDLALSGMDILPQLRRQFVRAAAGMAAMEMENG